MRVSPCDRIAFVSAVIAAILVRVVPSSLIHPLSCAGMGEAQFEGLLEWLLNMLKSDTNSVQRSGAAMGLSQVLYTLGKSLFVLCLCGVVVCC